MSSRSLAVPLLLCACAASAQDGGALPKFDRSKGPAAVAGKAVAPADPAAAAAALGTKKGRGRLSRGLFDYLTRPTGEGAFVAVPAERRPASDKTLAAAIDAWVQERAATDEGRQGLAPLSLLIDEGHPGRRGFDERMRAFTVGGAGAADAGMAVAGPFRGEASWVPGALGTAADFAAASVKEARVVQQMKASIENAEPPLVPGLSGKP
jgi:hypothetical protein